ncbi:MAG: GFA family protein [Phenylobacterium sp.]|uniref:GFA family protein n=1 Tax=Phenylobacterium sp. TaxID=1871053 RepID=UPI001A3E058D|nr:GFA family protein [Phenylobacterium sp.]MBL8553586.1 GFA family protein [Phenylobacterium sp.]
MHEGGCLCGGVRYAVEGPLAPVQFCHCGQCRKAQGSAFGANMPVASADFRLLQGEDLLREHRASPGKRRVFCGTCGSPIFSQRDAAPQTVRLRVGTLDGDGGGLVVGFHIHAASKAAWDEIDDGRTAYPGEAPD